MISLIKYSCAVNKAITCINTLLIFVSLPHAKSNHSIVTYVETYQEQTDVTRDIELAIIQTQNNEYIQLQYSTKLNTINDMSAFHIIKTVHEVITKCISLTIYKNMRTRKKGMASPQTGTKVLNPQFSPKIPFNKYFKRLTFIFASVQSSY